MQLIQNFSSITILNTFTYKIFKKDFLEKAFISKIILIKGFIIVIKLI